MGPAVETRRQLQSSPGLKMTLLVGKWGHGPVAGRNTRQVIKRLWNQRDGPAMKVAVILIPIGRPITL